jgi:DNA polymerase (family 10)
MTGRQLLRRPGYEVDIEKILKACAKHGVAVEINSNPWRLDLDWRWYQRAIELGCMFSIDPDAHSTSEIDLVRWGVGIARKGALLPGNILNCLGLKDFATYVRDRKRRSGPAQRARRSSSRSESRT